MERAVSYSFSLSFFLTFFSFLFWTQHTVALSVTVLLYVQGLWSILTVRCRSHTPRCHIPNQEHFTSLLIIHFQQCHRPNREDLHLLPGNVNCIARGLSLLPAFWSWWSPYANFGLKYLTRRFDVKKKGEKGPDFICHWTCQVDISPHGRSELP